MSLKSSEVCPVAAVHADTHLDTSVQVILIYSLYSLVFLFYFQSEFAPLSLLD